MRFQLLISHLVAQPDLEHFRGRAELDGLVEREHEKLVAPLHSRTHVVQQHCGLAVVSGGVVVVGGVRGG